MILVIVAFSFGKWSSIMFSFNWELSEESTCDIDAITSVVGFVHDFFIVCLCYVDLVSLGKHVTVTDYC